MGSIRHPLRAVDGWQRRHKFPGVAWAVQQKFGDDSANLRVVALGWYGFAAIFPLLLVVVTLLGYIGEASLGTGVVSTLRHFPIIGPSLQVGSNHRLHGNLFGLIVGLVGLVYGSQGVTQTAEQTMSTVWNIPQVDRPGFLPRLGRSFLGLATIGGTFLINSVGSGYAMGKNEAWAVRIPVLGVLLVFNIVAYLVAFRVLTPKNVSTRALRPGAVLGGIVFTALITVGTGLVEHQLKNTSNTYGTFGSVIGVVLFLFLLAKLSVYAAQLNPVLERQLYPRKFLVGEPTDADEQVWRDLVHQERRRKDQRVGVGFGEEAVAEAAADARQCCDGDNAPPNSEGPGDVDQSWVSSSSRGDRESGDDR